MSEWQNSEWQTHGEFGGRLGVGVKGTAEHLGFSMWHLLAAKMIGPAVQDDFLCRASEEVSTNELIDDLREGMAVFDHSYSSPWKKYAPYRSMRVSYASIVRRTAWKTPLGICRELRVPLILWPAGYEPTCKLHPVVRMFQAESCRVSGWPVDELC